MKKIFALMSLFLVWYAFLPTNIYSQDTKPSVVTSTFTGTLIVGEKFEYKIEIKLTTPLPAVEFQLLKGPEGLTIDSKGVVNWTPKSKGEFYAEYIVYTINNNVKTKIGSGVLKFRVVDFKGTITGVVTNEAGTEKLANVYMVLVKKVQVTGKPDSYLTILTTLTDKEGKYLFTVYEEGNYYLQAVSKGDKNSSWNPMDSYLPLWYKAAQTIDKADLIPVTKTSPNFVAENMKLKKNPNTVIVTYAFSATIVKNEPFTYQVNVTLPASLLPVEFKLNKALVDMTINAQTGLVSWIPKEKGEFSAEVGVFQKSTNLMIAKVIIKLNVVDFLGTLSGVVKNEAGEPLKGILVTLYKKITVTEKRTSYITSLSATTDDKGAYTIAKIEPGSYYAQARPGEDKTMSPLPNPNLIYMPVWWKDSPTMDKADVIVIAQTFVKVEANFTMHKYVKVEPKVFSISGKVTDAVTSNPIANATVFVSVAAKANGAQANEVALGVSLLTCSDPSFGLFTDVVYKTITDKDGNYKLTVKEGASYIVACYAVNYLMQYYNGKSNIAEATKLTPTKDETGIDFKLTAVPQAKAKVSGVVQNEAKAPVLAKVVLFTSPVSSITKPTSRSVSTNANGEFVFEKVPNGKYYVQVYPIKDYLPAYYKLNGCGVREPKDADMVTVANETDVTGVVVCVKKISTTGGGKISGMIAESNGSGIGGVIVTAESKDQTDIAYAISEGDGLFEIAGLGVGNYTITGEKFGYTTIIKEGSTIDYAKNAFNSNVNLVMNPNSTTAIGDQQIVPSDYNLYQNYPNPFNPETVISYQLPVASYVTLKVYDVLGKEIATLVNEFKQPGVYNSTFFTLRSSFASGIYFYILRARDFVSTRKMVLIK